MDVLPYVTSGRDPPFLGQIGATASRFLRRTPGNEPPGEGPYLCVYGLLNPYYLNRGICRLNNCEYFADALPAQIIHDLRSGRCRLLFDVSNEAVDWADVMARDLLSWLRENGISPGTVLILSQNRALSERDGIHFKAYDYFIKRAATDFSLDDSAFRAKFGFDRDVEASIAPLKARLYLCLNATPRPNRIAFVAALKHAGLLDHTLWSFRSMALSKQKYAADAIAAHLDEIGATHLMPYALELMDETVKFDRFRSEEGNDLVDAIDPAPYGASVISLVTETEFSSGSVLRITEKTIKSLCMGHPVIVAGNPGSLEMARAFGFEAEWPLIDSTNDSIADPKERFVELLRTVRDTPRRLTTVNGGWDARPFVEAGAYNREHARSGRFNASYEKTVELPLISWLTRWTQLVVV